MLRAIDDHELIDRIAGARDHYSVLGVEPTATAEEITAAYRKLVKTMHPDSKADADKFQESLHKVIDAYRTLSCAKKRILYDVNLFHAARSSSRMIAGVKLATWVGFAASCVAGLSIWLLYLPLEHSDERRASARSPNGQIAQLQPAGGPDQALQARQGFDAQSRPAVPSTDTAELKGSSQRSENASLAEAQHVATSRVTPDCPPSCSRSSEKLSEFKSVTALDIPDFLREYVDKGKGIVVRMGSARAGKGQTVRGAVNIPARVFLDGGAEHNYARILVALGARRDNQGEWDFTKAPTMLFLCGGPSCSESRGSIQKLISSGYPPDRLLHFRGDLDDLRTARPMLRSSAKSAFAETSQPDIATIK